MICLSILTIGAFEIFLQSDLICCSCTCIKNIRDTTKYVYAQNCQDWRTPMGVCHLFLYVGEVPTWLVPSGKSLKLVTPDHWKLSLANFESHKKRQKVLGTDLHSKVIEYLRHRLYKR